MAGGKRVQLGVQVNDGGVDMNTCGVGVQDLNLHMHLGHGYSQRGPVVDHCMFAEENDLAGGGSFHER
jgi:hypothetical protein